MKISIDTAAGTIQVGSGRVWRLEDLARPVVTYDADDFAEVFLAGRWRKVSAGEEPCR